MDQLTVNAWSQGVNFAAWHISRGETVAEVAPLVESHFGLLFAGLGLAVAQLAAQAVAASPGEIQVPGESVPISGAPSIPGGTGLSTVLNGYVMINVPGNPNPVGPVSITMVIDGSTFSIDDPNQITSMINMHIQDSLPAAGGGDVTSVTVFVNWVYIV
jgi:hypothetical protein